MSGCQKPGDSPGCQILRCTGGTICRDVKAARAVYMRVDQTRNDFMIAGVNHLPFG